MNGIRKPVIFPSSAFVHLLLKYISVSLSASGPASCSRPGCDFEPLDADAARGAPVRPAGQRLDRKVRRRRLPRED